MRFPILLCFFYFFVFISPVWAYIEEDNAGMAEADAGEQNTNMYKLNARGDYFIKKLKKIDEYASKNNQYEVPNLSDISDINKFEQKNKEEEQNKIIFADVSKIVSNPQQLKVVVKSDVYTSLLSINEIRDAQAVSMLQKQIMGGRR
ncbi:MAG: hypothetical protein IJ677_08565 [Alphaproteobacteria bacterium]|nr:hypothetical protein [Alphaproteobacteria bacterium]